ncbi:MAG: DNA gyrase subunit A [Planctomycetota bacterium]
MADTDANTPVPSDPAPPPGRPPAKGVKAPLPPPRVEGVVRELFIEDEVRKSYLSYAMSVIVSRALPDVRDGLKPSQRRILVAMNDLNLGPRAKYRKCAKIAGDTSGNYHPHGEAVVYPTLVRLAQDFNMREPLVDGQGNFGSIDGDPPAAMRYTEARMSEGGADMMTDLEFETVDFIPNYDETREEPVVLPARFPNLLVNGTTGIAVGMATSIPPHNLGEVVSALVAFIHNPDMATTELMTHLPGPDFPTGGLLCGTEGIRSGYETGRGHLVVRARVAFEEMRGGREQIVITEIPYQVNKGTLKERIIELARDDVIDGISDVRDESDLEGLRLVIELKRGIDREIVLNQLFKHTELQNTFSIILIALVDNRPRTLALKEILRHYLDHRVEVVRRRTAFLLRKAEARAHILEGLRIAVANLDEVVRIIRESKNPEAAKERLMTRFKLSAIQADAILAMRLSQLTNLEREKLEAEYQDLVAKIAEFRAILADRARQLAIVEAELLDLKKKYPGKRRTEITGAVEALDREDLIPDEAAAVTLSHQGYIKRMPLTTYRKQGRGGMGVSGMDMKEGDFTEHLFTASTHDYILFFTGRGRIHWRKVYDIPELSRTAKGRALVNLLSLEEGETVTSMIPVRTFEKGYLVMATEKGVIKKTELAAYGNPKRGGIIAISLDEGDRLIGVRRTSGEDHVVLGTKKGYAIRFPESDVRDMGRTAHGVGGITLDKDDAVEGLVVVDPAATLLTVCENGYGKRTVYDEYRVQHRNGGGIINIRTSERNGAVVGILDVHEGDDVMLLSAGGMVVRTAVAEISTVGRATQGVRLITLKESDKLVAIARVAPEKDANGNAPEAAPGMEEAGAKESGAEREMPPDAPTANGGNPV